ncbi:hypothetical protein [Prevotella sp. FD3004]|uniref:hypothetical protein n=1 Tax=Prevotella sp. FD3004 TaxID=1408309 RepID=UPI0005671CA3|nr:hypothetical protein [Prevotella sp. FD3004]
MSIDDMIIFNNLKRLLIAAKSIIRFGDAQTECVLAETLMSIFIAVMAGVVVPMGERGEIGK